MTKNVLLTLLLLIAWPEFMNSQSGAELDIKALAKSMEERFEACPRREVVGDIARKHNRHVWEKYAWGPPTEVFVDIKPNDSILYPYILTVEFSLNQTFGPERQSKSEAENDSDVRVRACSSKVAKRQIPHYLLSRQG